MRAAARLGPGHQENGHEGPWRDCHVQRPTLYRSLRQCHQRARAERSFLAAPHAHVQPFLAVDPGRTHVVQSQTVSRQQHVRAPIAEPATLGRQSTQPGPDSGLICPWRHIAICLRLEAHELGGPSLQVAFLLHRIGGGRSSRQRRLWFCEHRPQCRHGQHPLRQQLPPLGVLLLLVCQPAGIGHLYPAMLRFPFITRRVPEAVLAAKIGRRPRTGLMLLQHASSLLLRKPQPVHRPLPNGGFYLKAGASLEARSESHRSIFTRNLKCH